MSEDFCKRHMTDHYGTNCPICFELFRTKNKTLRAENTKFKELARWLRDGIQHFTSDEDRDQVEHLVKRINEIVGEK